MKLIQSNSTNLCALLFGLANIAQLKQGLGWRLLHHLVDYNVDMCFVYYFVGCDFDGEIRTAVLQSIAQV